MPHNLCYRNASTTTDDDDAAAAATAGDGDGGGALILDEQFSFSVGSFCSFYLPTFSSICQWHSGCFFHYVFFSSFHSFLLSIFLSLFHSHFVLCACLRVSQCALSTVCVCVFVLFCILDLFVYSSFLGEQRKSIQRIYTVCAFVWGCCEAIKRAGCDVRVRTQFKSFSPPVLVVGAVVMSMTPLIIIFTINFGRRSMDEN